MANLSILIPARHEEFLGKTIEDILQHSEGDTEIIAVLDGYWPDPPIKDHPRVTLIHHSEPIGQRAATNEAARVSRAKYLMKVDAHCAFDQGFDVKMMAHMHDNLTMVPVMRNLHAFDWVCPNGHRRYQSPSGPCTECGQPTQKEVVWISKRKPQSTAYRFDRTLRFQYWNSFGRKQQGDITESLSLQGSCFMVTRERYFALDLCSESFHSWGQQGVEVACKTWLSGGRVVVNRTTWYAHLFRTQGKDFSFPYHNPEKAIQENRELSRTLFEHNQWPLAIHPFSWLIEKFHPPGWEEGRAQTKGIVYYTDNQIDQHIFKRCQEQLQHAAGTIPIVSVSLQPLSFGRNIIFPGERSVLTMFRQILAGLEALDTDVAFLCEHDVLYHPSHFDFTPPRDDTYYYNMHSWIVRTTDGHAVAFDHKSVSGLCANRKLLIAHYKERIRRVETEGFSRRMGFEPGTHGRPQRVDNIPCEGWRSAVANLDLKHGKNLTTARWSPTQFRSQKSCRNWQETDVIPGWGTMAEYI